MDLTSRVLIAYEKIENQRLKSLVLILIKHLHACVNEMSLTDQEFEFAWDFMGRMAAKTGPERNEFLLLSDVLGVSQLIESLNHDRLGQLVGSSPVGPSSAPMHRFAKEEPRISAMILPGHASAFPEEYTTLIARLRSRVRFSIHGRQRRMGCMRTRIRTSPITTCGAATRPT
jgi:hypothetical protein